MAKEKKKLTPSQKAAKKKQQEEYMTIFINGKQKRVKQPTTIDGMSESGSGASIIHIPGSFFVFASTFINILRSTLVYPIKKINEVLNYEIK